MNTKMNLWLQRATVGALVVGGALALQGCVPLLLGGAVAGGLSAATDRRTTGTTIEDQGIELKAAGRIDEKLGERVHVNVTSYNRVVLLTGEAPTAQDKQTVEKIVGGVDNVSRIVNEIEILGNSTLSQRSSDTLVTGRVKAALVDAKDLFANAFKITTEHGTTYLMGRVTQREANRATELARGTTGVQKVVRVFEIISEEELASMPVVQPPPKGNK